MTDQNLIPKHDDTADEASSLLLTATKKTYGVPTRRAIIATMCFLLGTLAVVYSTTIGGNVRKIKHSKKTNAHVNGGTSAALLLGHNQAAPVAECSKYGGDCSHTPTDCDRARRSENVVDCYCEGPRFYDEDTPPKSDDAHLCRHKECSEQVYQDFPEWCSSDYSMRFGGCSGGCSGTHTCLNLDFTCGKGKYCEMKCYGDSSCEGLTMHCADNQFCELKCYGRGSCVNAKVKCGEGTVAQSYGKSHKCVLADPHHDCDTPIEPENPSPPQTSCFKCVSGEHCCHTYQGFWDYKCPHCAGSF